MRSWIWCLPVLAAAAPVLAHDFWVQPAQFTLAAPGRVPVMVYVGHGAARERWGVGLDRVVQFRSVGPDGLIDRKGDLTLQGAAQDAVVSFARPGAYVLGFQSRPSASELPFLRFNQYLAEEGLTPIQAHRAASKTERADGREQYSRRAKAIVQVGAIDAASVARVTRPVGLSLEIVPERHPGTLRPGEMLSVRVLRDQRPLPGALVKLTNLSADETPVAMLRTDRAGRASFAIPRRGSWQFNVVWAEVVTGAPAPYRTTFSSLTFGT